MSKKKRMTMERFRELYNELESDSKKEENINIPNARIIEHSQKEIEEMERKEKERKFWNNIVRGDCLGGKKGHDN